MCHLLVLLLLSTAPLAAQDHAHHGGHGSHGGLPTLRPIAEGSLHTAADVQFMQGMIAHHAQAIRMSVLAATRSGDARLIRFAQKIDQSQTSEIQLMGDWLAERRQVVPDSTTWTQITMPGMLTAAELAELATLTGTAFDRRFLELMIRHHEGAIAMVADLFVTPRAGQEVDVNVFANEVEQVQSVEIALMRQMLATLEGAR
ncbi:MAG: DUF305 domain-containing protein [Phycisphaerales bacterium]